MKAHAHSTLRSLALLLCIALCAALLGSCGAQANAETEAGTAADRQEDRPSGESEEREELPTLWDKSVSLEAVQLPEKAFDEPEARLFGLSADGSKALISSCSESYLYDLDTGWKTYLVPGDEQTEETLRFLASALFRNLSPEEAAERTASLEKLHGRELAKLGLSVQAPGRTLVRALDLPGSDGSWMLLNVPGNGLMLLLDTRTGEFYCRFEGEYLDARGDRMLAMGPRPVGGLILVDRSTGKETPVVSLHADFNVVTAAFLPDEGVVAVMRDRELDVEHGEKCLVALRGADGETHSFELGTIRYGMEPDEIICLGEDRLLLRNQQASVLSGYLIDRSSGEVSLLTLQKGSVTPIPPSFDETGRPAQLPEGTEQLFPIAALRDGKTVLLQGKDSICYLYRPETGETRMVMLGLGWDLLPVISLSNFTYNGYDRLWMSAAPRDKDWSRQYFQFTVKG